MKGRSGPRDHGAILVWRERARFSTRRPQSAAARSRNRDDAVRAHRSAAYRRFRCSRGGTRITRLDRFGDDRPGVQLRRGAVDVEFAGRRRGAIAAVRIAAVRRGAVWRLRGRLVLESIALRAFRSILTTVATAAGIRSTATVRSGVSCSIRKREHAGPEDPHWCARQASTAHAAAAWGDACHACRAARRVR